MSSPSRPSSCMQVQFAGLHFCRHGTHRAWPPQPAIAARNILRFTDADDVRPMRSTTVRSAVAAWVIGFVALTALTALTALPARADVTTLRIARQYGIGYLQM